MRVLSRTWSLLTKGSSAPSFRPQKPSPCRFAHDCQPACHQLPTKPHKGVEFPCLPCVRVAVMGANTPTGIVASRYLKTSKYIHELRLIDKDPLVKATTHDLCDVDTCCVVLGYAGNEEAKCGLLDVDIVLVAVGKGEGAPLTPAEVFNENIPAVGEAICLIGSFAPCAKVVIASDPVNSMVPFAAELLLQMYKLDHSRLLGSSMDALRAATLIAQVTGIPADRSSVTVVGGRSVCTAVPVFSLSRPWSNFRHSIRDCVGQVLLDEVRTKWCEQATLLASLPEGGYVVRGTAAARTVLALARAMNGYRETISAMVRSDILPPHRYMVTEVALAREGVSKNLGIPKLECQEIRSLEAALPFLEQDVARGENAGRSFLLDIPSVRLSTTTTQ